MPHPLRLAVPTVLALLLAGCSWFGGNKTEEYKGAQARADQPLEVPPELTAPTMDDRYSIPDPRSQTNYSDYSKQVGPQGTKQAVAQPVLPDVQGVRMDREGDQRWLVVKGEPDKVWPVIRQFWIDGGFALSRESPEVGIMETEWHEDRAKIPQDFIRRTIGRAIEGVYSTPRRDKFRTRLEKGAQPGTTEVFVSNRAMEEVYTNQNQDTTKWQPLPADRELEAEMLSRIMVKLGGEETKVAAAQAKAPAGRAALAQAQAPATAPTSAVLENSGAGPLVLSDGFDRAWRRVGLALDRTGFTVEDRDRTQGTYFVRYVEPNADKKSSNFLSRLFSSDTPGPPVKYRISLKSQGESTTVSVLTEKGAPENSATAQRIVKLIADDLR